MDTNKQRSQRTRRVGIYFNPLKYIPLKIKVMEKGFRSVSHWVDVKIDEFLESK